MKRKVKYLLGIPDFERMLIAVKKYKSALFKNSVSGKLGFTYVVE
ncbi:hypothetical protein BCF59_0217 [Mycoplasmopsis mustelae]|uniref:Uncharacterized protein n=1 Tax=Mycoplasmopsis mustelae TaxID=171289 RepID=A0A4R7UEH0_9BACT|nr:hypothetical protein [Mycoplasmopsis mustelae]TDV24263.1 hypothetical protein BCF59_0217 [Mycoplasmopsis mustelae]